MVALHLGDILSFQRAVLQLAERAFPFQCKSVNCKCDDHALLIVKLSVSFNAINDIFICYLPLFMDSSQILLWIVCQIILVSLQKCNFNFSHNEHTKVYISTNEYFVLHIIDVHVCMKHLKIFN